MKPRKRAVGRRRWAALCRFLEKTMQESGSERTRMQAAMRLCDVLLTREEREQAELRAAAKAQDKATNTPEPSADMPEVETSAEDERMRAAFAFLTRAANAE